MSETMMGNAPVPLSMDFHQRREENRVNLYVLGMILSLSPAKKVERKERMDKRRVSCSIDICQEIVARDKLLQYPMMDRQKAPSTCLQQPRMGMISQWGYVCLVGSFYKILMIGFKVAKIKIGVGKVPII